MLEIGVDIEGLGVEKCVQFVVGFSLFDCVGVVVFCVIFGVMYLFVRCLLLFVLENSIVLVGIMISLKFVVGLQNVLVFVVVV